MAAVAVSMIVSIGAGLGVTGALAAYAQRNWARRGSQASLETAE